MNSSATEYYAEPQTDRPITALAYSGNDIATASELSNHQAVVSVW